jgi:hypothetical protein
MKQPVNQSLPDRAPDPEAQLLNMVYAMILSWPEPESRPAPRGGRVVKMKCGTKSKARSAQVGRATA